MRFSPPFMPLRMDAYPLDGSDPPPTAEALNDACIAMVIGNYLGRALNVGTRALALVEGRFDAIPRARDARLLALSSTVRGPWVAATSRDDRYAARQQRRALRRARRDW